MSGHLIMWDLCLKLLFLDDCVNPLTPLLAIPGRCTLLFPTLERRLLNREKIKTSSEDREPNIYRNCFQKFLLTKAKFVKHSLSPIQTFNRVEVIGSNPNAAHWGMKQTSQFDTTALSLETQLDQSKTYQINLCLSKSARIWTSPFLGIFPYCAGYKGEEPMVKDH